jgi:hypothetical protein
MTLDRSRLGKRLASIERDLREIKDFLQWLKPKRALCFEEALPPRSICRDALSKMKGTTSYTGFLAFLSNYYGVPRLKLYHDENRVSAKAIAAYYARENAAYSKSSTMDSHTVLHEFFHHLVAHGVVMVKEEDRERRADEFASIVLARGGQR